MATISAFKANLLQGGSRPNQFRVKLTFPDFVGAQGTDAARSAEFLCRSASLPASSVDDITTYFRGRPVHLAGERTFQPWAVTIYNESNFLIRNAFEKWSNSIVNYGATNGLVQPIMYQVDMSVYQLDRNDRVVKEYRFFDAYPVNVGGIGLDFEDNARIEQFDVTFVYNYFLASDVS